MSKVNICLRLLLFCLVFGLFFVHQSSIVLLISRRESVQTSEWVSITLSVILIPYLSSFLSQLWKSSFLTGGKWKEWPHWGSVLLGSISAVAESYTLTCLFYNLLHKVPIYFVSGILNSALAISIVLTGKKTKSPLRYVNTLFKCMFVGCVVTSGILLAVTSAMSTKDAAMLVLFLLIVSAIVTPNLQNYIHSTSNQGIQNSALLYLTLKILTTVISTYFLQREANLKDDVESIRRFFTSIHVPSKTDLWLCLAILLSSFLCQFVHYFRASSNTKLNIHLPMYITLPILTILVTLIHAGTLKVSYLPIEGIISRTKEITFTDIDIALYGVIIELLVFPILILFLSTDSNQGSSVYLYNAVLTSQYLLSASTGNTIYYSHKKSTAKRSSRRRIFICTTMYQESEIEMDRLLASIKNVSDSEMLKRENVILESHIFLDNGSSGQDIKQFGLQLLGLAEENLIKDNEQGVMLYTPYGIQLSWKLDNDMPLFIHLKDISKVKAKKRWSQVMYMKYVLNYRSSKFRRPSGNLSKHSSYASLLSVESTTSVNWKSKTMSNNLSVPDSRPNSSNNDIDINSIDTETTTVPYVEIFIADTSSIDNLSTKQENSLYTAQSTQDLYADDFDFDTDDFILATDADMTFVDSSIMDVLHMLEADNSVGSVCGRTRPKGVHIHPIVWLQMFDYAKDFWMIKSAQNIIGSVMCCPGCFSMYKLDAVRDIVDEYSGSVETMEDVFTKDNGEDRWMCTLMMLKGWKLRYSSSARNTTFCPEDTAEFMKQRRRWLLSDYANAILVIRKLKGLITKNDAFSALYTFYILQLFLIMLLYPGSTIVMLCLGLELATGAPLVIVTPVIVTVILAYCLLLLSKFSFTTQTVITKALIIIFGAGTVYIFVSSTVIIFKALAKGFESGNFEHAEGFLVMVVIGSYIYGALLYPTDIWILVTGVVYLFFIPFMNMILPLYAVCNIVDQSWGTRDNQKAAVPSFLQLPKIKRKMKKGRKSQQVETTSLQSLSASSLSINDYNQSEFEFWEELVSNTVGANLSNGMSENERRIGLKKLRKKALIFFLCTNFLCIIALVGLYAFLMQTFSNKSTFSIVMGITLGLSPLIQISGSTVYRIDDVLTRIGRWISS